MWLWLSNQSLWTSKKITSLILIITLTPSFLSGNCSRADFCCSLHHSQCLHITGPAAPSPSSGGGKGTSWAGGWGPWLRLPQQSLAIRCHYREGGRCCWHWDNLPAEWRLSQPPEPQQWFPTVLFPRTLFEPGQTEPVTLHRLCCQRGAPLPAASLWWLPDGTADVWIRRKSLWRKTKIRAEKLFYILKLNLSTTLHQRHRTKQPEIHFQKLLQQTGYLQWKVLD